VPEPASVTVTVEGIPENRARLEAIAAGVDHLEATHRAIAELLRPAAAANVPNTTGRGTGYLAASLVAAGDDRGGWLESSAEYAALIEARFGFVTRAAEAGTDAAAARYEEGIAELIAANS
jgi:hypothetical protein